jgi:hypothetical protein
MCQVAIRRFVGFVVFVEIFVVFVLPRNGYSYW